jgi:hypothetical protein
VIVVLDRDEDDQSVLAQEPEGGSAFRTSVDLEVTRRGVVNYLIDMSPVEGGLGGSGTYTINGETYTRSVAAETHHGRNRQRQIAGYDLGRRYELFEATLGVSDAVPSGFRASFAILGDGDVLHETVLELGESEPVAIDVHGVLRLRLEVTDLRDQPNFRAYDSVFADARLVALPSRVSDLDD